MSYLNIKEISKKIDISITTLTTLLCRPEFIKYMYNKDSVWNKCFDYNSCFLEDIKKFFIKRNNFEIVKKINKIIKEENATRNNQ